MQLYIHIPFCKSKCAYCDFNSYASCDDGTIYSYLSALNRELRFAAEHFGQALINSVYIGGGTPSLLSGNDVKKIAQTIKNNFNCKIEEFTIECNPESIEEAKLETYSECGINRLSVGVQSLDDNNLKSIGRIHNSESALKALSLAGKYFKNISADLIVGLPYDTKSIVENEVERLIPLIKHLSVYELSLEEGTPLKQRADEGSVLLPDDDELRSFFDVAEKVADKAGFNRYEISNFAKEGYKSRHNFGYWIREEYLGTGAGAHSFVKTSDGKKELPNSLRFASPKDIHAYIAGVNCVDTYDKIPRAEFDVIDEKSAREEKIMLGLRTSDGIDENLLDNKSIDEFRRFFNNKNGKISLNSEGMAVMNSILIKII